MSKLYDTCIIGLGPAGIGFISSLNNSILKNSICFEKGNDSSYCGCHTNSTCFSCEQCNIVSGLGGASRFSCGKISNFPAGSGLLQFWNSNEVELLNFMSSEIDALSEKLALKKIDISAGSRKVAESLFSINDITYKYYDVYEFQKEQYLSYLSDTVCRAQTIGLQIHYNTEVLEIKKDNHENIYSIITKEKGGTSKYYANKVVLATGNINDGTKKIKNLTNKNCKTSYEIGVRITVPTEKIATTLDTHGDLKLKYKNGRTYCVSKNGFIVAYSVNDALFLEGYVDNFSSSNLTNLAIIIKCNDQHLLDTFKRTYSTVYNGIPIKQRYDDYLNDKESILDFSEKYIPVQKGNIKNVFSEEINSNIIDFIEHVLITTLGLNREDLIIYAPELKETNYFEINNNFQVEDNIFVIGAATGKFRGILQSLCSGIHCANSLRR